eukprot:5451985-Amphidinium_carterae.1
MQAVTFFHILENSFTGRLPESGLRVVTDFRIHKNRFAGALPDGGMRAMLAMTIFSIFWEWFHRNASREQPQG